MANGRCRMHGGKSTGAPMGNQNGYKHGYYSSASTARRREVSELIRSMKDLVAEVVT